MFRWVNLRFLRFFPCCPLSAAEGHLHSSSTVCHTVSATAEYQLLYQL